MISYEEDIERDKTTDPISFQEDIKHFPLEKGIVSYDQDITGLTKPKMEERSFIAKHPNLYGAFGVAQALIPYVQYIDPTERKRFAKLSTQKQTRELLLQNLETVAILAAPVITKGAVPIVARFLPKTYKALKFAKTPIKEWGKLRKTPAKEVAETGLERAVARLTPKPKPVVAPEPKKSPVLKQILGEKPSPIEKVTQAIKEATSKRKVQQQIYSEELGKKLGRALTAAEREVGEKRYFAMLKEMKGELTKVEFESLRGKISQKEMTELFEMIWKSPDIRGFENINAYKALGKLFGEFGGRVPQPKEIELLRRVFPEEFIQALLEKQPLFKKFTEAGFQIANIPRSIMSSFDVSAPFRQGLFLTSHPKRFGQAFVKMFKQFSSEEIFAASQESIAKRPTYELMKESGLALTELGKHMGFREEMFMGSWAEKIPIVGRGVRASGRAYTGFLNKLRADVFDDLIKKASKLGLDPQNNMDLTKQIAKFINVASGRGNLGALESSAVALNSFFFSPRLMASRLTLLNPAYYVKADPFVRKEALKSLFTVMALSGTVLGLAKAGGANVGMDPRSADFLKIKIGDTRIDILGGVQQYLRAIGQLITGEYVSSTTGKVVTLGEGYRPLTRYEIILRQLESKEAPVASFMTTLLKGQDITGERVNIPKEILDRFKPMALNDIYEIAKEDPELLPFSLLSMFGVGLQTYKDRPPRMKGGFKAIGKQ